MPNEPKKIPPGMEVDSDSDGRLEAYYIGAICHGETRDEAVSRVLGILAEVIAKARRDGWEF